MLLAHQSLRRSLEEAGHGPIAQEGHGSRQRLDLHLGAQGQGAGPERAIHFPARVHHAVRVLAPHVHLDARFGGDHVHLRAAVGENGMDTDGVLVAERLPDGIDSRERDLRGIERIDAHVRRPAGM